MLRAVWSSVNVRLEDTNPPPARGLVVLRVVAAPMNPPVAPDTEMYW
jgi:hypothetical protein